MPYRPPNSFREVKQQLVNLVPLKHVDYSVRCLVKTHSLKTVGRCMFKLWLHLS